MSVVANVAINVDAKGAVGELNKVDRAASELNQSFSGLKAAVAALGLGVAIKSIADVGQRSEQTKNQIRALTAQYGELEAATASVDRIQKVLGVSTLDAREGFSQLYAALRGTGVSVEQLEVLFVGLTNAARMSGAGAAEAQGALLQLKQAFASGTLSGDELRSVLEAMPAFTQQLAKETDRLGLTTNATSADIKKLGSEGKITSDILFAAAKTLAQSNAPNITTAEQLGVAFTNLREKLAETFGPVIIDGVRIFGASLTALSNWFKANQSPIQSVSGILIGLLKALGPGAAAVLVVVKAYQAWTTATKALAAAQAFLTALSGPKGIALVAGAAVAAGVAYAGLNKLLEGTEKELKKQTSESEKASNAFNNIVKTTQPLPVKIKEAATATSGLVSAATMQLGIAKQNTAEIQNQINSLDLTAQSVNNRFAIEKQLNDLQIQQLERQYSYAKTELERYEIAKKIFKEQLQGAQIEYNQAIARLEIEQQKLNLQIEAAAAKNDEIIAEAELQKLKAQDIENDTKRLQKLQEIDDQVTNAIEAQNQVVQGLIDQQPIQNQILQQEAEMARLKFEANKLTAQTSFEQKLVSDEIGVSEANARKLSFAIAENVTVTNTLATSMANVAQQAAYAAQQIQNAINLQNMLNGGGNMNAGSTQAYAEGGYVTGPTQAIVGEGGEPEYVIPASKMSEAMGRYASGARGASVIPESGASSVSGYSADTSSINPVVNVTTGPVMNMNNSNYVSQADFLAGLQAASRQGAQMALATLQNNSSTRRAVGVR